MLRLRHPATCSPGRFILAAFKVGESFKVVEDSNLKGVGRGEGELGRWGRRGRGWQHPARGATAWPTQEPPRDRPSRPLSVAVASPAPAQSPHQWVLCFSMFFFLFCFVFWSFVLAFAWFWRGLVETALIYHPRFWRREV